MLNLKQYEQFVIEGNRTKEQPEIINKMHLLAGLCSETGEIASHVQKALRKTHNLEINKKEIKLELGDCLWYLTALINAFDSSLEEIITLNKEKLDKRYKNV